MHIEAEAIVCAVRAHGEHGAIVRSLTPADGLLAGYVRGGRSRRLRPILIPGNIVRGDWRARTDEQLPALTVELVESRAPLLAEPLPAAVIDWATAFAAAALPEGQPHSQLYAALDGLLAAVAAAPAARGWASALIRYEMLALGELGYGAFDAPPPSETDWPAVMGALEENGARLRRHLFAERRAWVLDARERLVARLKRVAR